MPARLMPKRLVTSATIANVLVGFAWAYAGATLGAGAAAVPQLVQKLPEVIWVPHVVQ